MRRQARENHQRRRSLKRMKCWRQPSSAIDLMLWQMGAKETRLRENERWLAPRSRRRKKKMRRQARAPQAQAPRQPGGVRLIGACFITLQEKGNPIKTFLERIWTFGSSMKLLWVAVVQPNQMFRIEARCFWSMAHEIQRWAWGAYCTSQAGVGHAGYSIARDAKMGFHATGATFARLQKTT